jgi:DNA-binding transcriptional regulator YiaG
MSEVNNTEWTPERIRALRERYKLTQQEAAERVGVGKAMWCHWEKGRHAPTRPFQILFLLFERGVLDAAESTD